MPTKSAKNSTKYAGERGGHIKTMIHPKFNSMIGQKQAKLALSNHIYSSHKGNMIPAFMYTGERGVGKTTAMRLTLEALECEIVLPEMPLDENGKPLLPTPQMLRGESGCQAAMNSFFEHLIVSLSTDQRVCIVLDEFHLLSAKSPATYKRLFDFLMSICLLSNEARSGSVKCGENYVVWNPSKHFIIAGTNYPEKINSALFSRFRNVPLASYTPEEMFQIIEALVKEKGFRANSETIKPLANVCRNTAREANGILSEIASVIGAQGKSTVNQVDVKTALQGIGKYPFGFERDFVRAMQTIDGVSYSTPVLESLFPSQKGRMGDELAIAWNHKLVARSTRGWTLTEKGKRAIETWKKDGFEID